MDLERRVTNSRPSSRQPKSRAESSSMDSAWRLDLSKRLEVMSWRISGRSLEVWQMVPEGGILACLFQRLGFNTYLFIPALGFSFEKIFIDVLRCL